MLDNDDTEVLRQRFAKERKRRQQAERILHEAVTHEPLRRGIGP